MKVIELTNLSGLSIGQSKLFLTDLTEDKIIFTTDYFYGIRPNLLEQITERKSKEDKTQKYKQKLPSYVKIIKAFHFVRFISVSGSLSKNVMHEDGDIDYFIIAAPGRLWSTERIPTKNRQIKHYVMRVLFTHSYFLRFDIKQWNQSKPYPPLAKIQAAAVLREKTPKEKRILIKIDFLENLVCEKQ